MMRSEIQSDGRFIFDINVNITDNNSCRESQELSLYS